MRLDEAGIDKNVLATAVSQFCLEIIANHGYAAPRLCNKDPLTLKYGVLLAELFPNVSIHSEEEFSLQIFTFVIFLDQISFHGS